MISRIEVCDYRSIRGLDFNPPPLCALSGPNNVGKSNILKALETLLGEIYPANRAFDRNDFYNRNTEAEIKISIWFAPPLSSCRCKKDVAL